MDTTSQNEPQLDPQIVADEQAVFESFLRGTAVDHEIAHRVHERAMRVREEIYRQHGLVDIGVPAIRELRGELPE